MLSRKPRPGFYSQRRYHENPDRGFVRNDVITKTPAGVLFAMMLSRKTGRTFFLLPAVELRHRVTLLTFATRRSREQALE
jgi:hypothetical protein